jgi:hypothetical protein
MKLPKLRVASSARKQVENAPELTSKLRRTTRKGRFDSLPECEESYLNLLYSIKRTAERNSLILKILGLILASPLAIEVAKNISAFIMPLPAGTQSFQKPPLDSSGNIKPSELPKSGKWLREPVAWK